jgi:hypothetical protein
MRRAMCRVAAKEEEMEMARDVLLGNCPLRQRKPCLGRKKQQSIELSLDSRLLVNTGTSYGFNEEAVC